MTDKEITVNLIRNTFDCCVSDEMKKIQESVIFNKPDSEIMKHVYAVRLLERMKEIILQ